MYHDFGWPLKFPRVFSRPKNQPHNLTMLRMENLCITEVGMAMNASGDNCSRGEVDDTPGGLGLPVCTRFRRAARFAPPLSPDLPFHTAPVFVHRIENTPMGENVAHEFPYVVAALENLRLQFGEDFRSKVVVLYDTATGKQSMPHRRFYEGLLSKRTLVMKDSPPQKTPGGVCFREGWFNRMNLDADHRRHNDQAMSLREPVIRDRDEVDRLNLERFRRHFVRCHGGTIRIRPNVRAPRVTLIVRTRNRVIKDFEHLQPEYAHAVEARGGRFSVFDEALVPASQLAKVITDTDVLVGAYGGALLWSVLMAPGSVAIQFKASHKPLVEGWKLSGKDCQYAYYAAVRRTHYYNRNVPAHDRFPYGAEVPREWRLNLTTFGEVLDAAMLRLRGGSGVTQ